MTTLADGVQDLMQVCRNGHVITDLLRSYPERALTHCDRCGAATMQRCETCGHELPGALVGHGLHPVGARRPPRYCEACGAAFPWTRQARPPRREALVVLENLLRRLPRVARELRSRHGDRPPFRVTDEHDLEDLVRSLLPLHFDDVRPECRTPRYSAGTRTDFVLMPEGVALVLKLAHPRVAEELAEDVAYYRGERKCRTLVVLVYDSEGKLREPPRPLDGATEGDELELRCVLVVP